MAAIANARDLLLQAAPVRLLPVTLPSNTSIPFDQVNGATKPSNNADVTATAVNGTVIITGGGITLSGGGAIKGGQTAFDTGVGWFLGFSGGEYKFSIKNASGHKVTIDSSGLNIVGAITGASSISLTGSAQFEGITTGGSDTAAILANTSGNSHYGVLAQAGASGVGVGGIGSASGSFGVSGLGIGAGRTGVGAAGSFGAKALSIDGTTTNTNSTLVANLNAELWNGLSLVSTSATGAATATFNASNKPGTNTTNVWQQVTLANGKTAYQALWVEP